MRRRGRFDFETAFEKVKTNGKDISYMNCKRTPASAFQFQSDL